jgi:CMP-N-acetylneuraminic acid synthetase
MNRLVQDIMEVIDCLAILRPTSSLLTPSTVRNAMLKFNENQLAASLRAVEVRHLHPGNMWRVDANNGASTY